MYPPFSVSVLSLSFKREAPETSRYSKTNWASQRELLTLIYLFIWPSVFLCLFYRGNTFLHMKCPEPLLCFLNVFWFDEPNHLGVSLLSAYPLSKFVSHKKKQRVEMFLISGCSFWLGHIWCFAVLIYAQISELSFQWCIYHIHLKEIGGTKHPTPMCYGYIYTVILLRGHRWCLKVSRAQLHLLSLHLWTAQAPADFVVNSAKAILSTQNQPNLQGGRLQKKDSNLTVLFQQL